MKRPEMILFDAGKTLLNYLDMDTRRGVEAYMPYLTANPRHLTAQEIDSGVNAVFETFEDCRRQLFEVHEQTILKLAFDLLELKFSIPISDIERIIWENDARIVPVDGTEKMLAYLNKTGIRTGVISNLDFSGALLEDRLNRIFPDNRFEFVIASSDYGIRKPMSGLFQAGIVRTGLAPGDIWYVGDKENVDAAGSSACGMQPVLLKSEGNRYRELPEDILTVWNYDQLIRLLESCEQAMCDCRGFA